ncbi:MAG: hypothetical protein R2860_02100 [Desulfobacterales bacterium]
MSHISVTVLLTGLTTFVAFLTLATHELSAIRGMGDFFSTLGSPFAVLISAPAIPAGLVLMPHHQANSRVRKNRRIHRLSTDDPLDHQGRHLSLQKGAAVVMLLIVRLLPVYSTKVETELLYYFKENNFIRTSAKLIEEKFGGRWGFNVLILISLTVSYARYLQTVSDFRKLDGM